jgi:ADP-heptose:LPS heptosyltransferase
MDATSWKRVLWVRLDHIGDVVMSLPMLANLCAALPGREIDCLVKPAVAPLLRATGLPVRVITYDTPRFPERRTRFSLGPLGRGAGIFRTTALARRLRARRYDAAFELRGDEVGRVLAYLSGAPVRIGPDRQFYEVPGRRNGAVLLTNRVPFPIEPRHAVLNNLELLRAAGLPITTETFRFPITDSMRELLEAKLAALEAEPPIVAIHACSNDPERNWETNKWVAIIQNLLSLSPVSIVLTGATRDRKEIAAIRTACGTPERVLDASGRFKLEELPAFFERIRLLITVDTGPMHIAALQGTPVVALMRDDLAPRHHPWQQPDSAVTSGAGRPVGEIPADAVWEKVVAQLEAANPNSTSPAKL